MKPEDDEKSKAFLMKRVKNLSSSNIKYKYINFYNHNVRVCVCNYIIIITFTKHWIAVDSSVQ